MNSGCAFEFANLNLFKNISFDGTNRYWFGESENTDGKVENSTRKYLVLGLLHAEENT